MDSLSVTGNPTCDELMCPSPTVADQRRTLTGFPEELPCSAFDAPETYHFHIRSCLGVRQAELALRSAPGLEALFLSVYTSRYLDLVLDVRATSA
jgi:hypothetical protein